MKKVTLGARLIMGLIFVVFGLNGFFHFIPMPPMPEAAGKFMGALGATGYFFPFLKVCEIVAGLFLVIGAFVPLALIILAPIIINIVLFHAFLAPGGMLLPIVLVILEAYLAFFSDPYSGIVKQIFRCPMKDAMCCAEKGK